MDKRRADAIFLALIGVAAAGLTVGVVSLARPASEGVWIVLGVAGATTAAAVAVTAWRDGRRRFAADTQGVGRVGTWLMLLAIGAVPLLELGSRLVELAAVAMGDAILLAMLAIVAIRRLRN